jgi:hypothetical protein
MARANEDARTATQVEQLMQEIDSGRSSPVHSMLKGGEERVRIGHQERLWNLAR